ncbi:hypothetical protein GOP47_0003247 [Adiantum capillus-veneris]|uniref:GIR1-like zinc ribbon domain-containing protein n=1 Tax=Adiantum capillus-veneris TaxID=13818 RepID=A0A9D4VBV6_ADICA|nr:hypothetical protein GOP47_0003247 [Adiantum capillus-veneris]
MAAFVEASWASSVTKKGGWEEVEDSKLMLELMLSSVGRNCTQNNTSTANVEDLRTLDLLGSAACNVQCLDINVDCSPSRPLPSVDALDFEVVPLPPGWQKCLDLQTGRVYYLQNNGSSSGNKRPCNAPNTFLASSYSDVPGGHLPSMSMETNLKQATAAITPSKRVRRREEADDVDWTCEKTAANVSIFGVNFNSPPPLPKWQHGSSARQESHGTDVASDMTTVGCAKCLMFVMLSATDPHCPNCGSSAVLDFSQPVTKKAKQA